MTNILLYYVHLKYGRNKVAKILLKYRNQSRNSIIRVIWTYAILIAVTDVWCWPNRIISSINHYTLKWCKWLHSFSNFCHNSNSEHLLHSDYIILFLHKLNPTFWVINWSFNICKQKIYGLYCTIFSKYFSEL